MHKYNTFPVNCNANEQKFSFWGFLCALLRSHYVSTSWARVLWLQATVSDESQLIMIRWKSKKSEDQGENDIKQV